jgi:hypothetical protein
MQVSGATPGVTDCLFSLLSSTGWETKGIDEILHCIALHCTAARIRTCRYVHLVRLGLQYAGMPVICLAGPMQHLPRPLLSRRTALESEPVNLGASIAILETGRFLRPDCWSMGVAVTVDGIAEFG